MAHAVSLRMIHHEGAFYFGRKGEIILKIESVTRGGVMREVKKTPSASIWGNNDESRVFCLILLKGPGE